MIRTAILLALAVVVSASHAAAGSLNAQVGIRGQKQGDFKSLVANRKIPLVAIATEVKAPRDAASGMATGKIVWSSIVITKSQDVSTPQFFTALSTNESLAVDLELVKTDPRGAAPKPALTIKLMNAQVVGIRQYTVDRGTTAELMEEISIQFQQIDMTSDPQVQFKADAGAPR